MGSDIQLQDKNGNTAEDRRDRMRRDITKGIKVNFSVEYEGEIINISESGFAIKFHPIGTKSLDAGKSLRLQLNMGDKILSVNSEVRQLTEKFGHLLLGVEYDRNDLMIIELPDSDAANVNEPVKVERG